MKFFDRFLLIALLAVQSLVYPLTHQCASYPRDRDGEAFRQGSIYGDRDRDIYRDRGRDYFNSGRNSGNFLMFSSFETFSLIAPKPR